MKRRPQLIVGGEGKRREETTSRPLLAVGLAYDEEVAPTVSVIGRRKVARQLMHLARRYGITVRDNPQLANQLAELDTDQEIPIELYEEVAELLCELEE